MQDFEEQERRLMAALGRLGAAMERLGDAPTAAELAAAEEIDSAAEVEIARLSHLLEAEQAARAELETRLGLGQEHQAATLAALEGRVGSMTAQLEGQSQEVQRLRVVNVQLREALRALREALSEGVAEPSQINRALQAEVEAMRTARQIETAEIEALLRAIDPLIQSGIQSGIQTGGDAGQDPAATQAGGAGSDRAAGPAAATNPEEAGNA